jgi:RNA polymerase sigma factor (sigma-70 family)
MGAQHADAPGLASRVYGDHGPAVRRYFHRLTRNPDLADDLAQEVFLKVVRAAGTYQPQERERAWVFRIAQNVLLDHYRRAGAHARTRSTSSRCRHPRNVAADLQHALARLAPDDREVFLLGEVGGLSYAEIASTARHDGAGRPLADLPRAAGAARDVDAARAAHRRGGQEVRR